MAVGACTAGGANGHDAKTVETEEEEEEDLLASFPHLRGLEVLAPPEDWGRTPIPDLPAEVASGVLGNGLTYFVQENREPKARAELFLIVGFGSLVEEEEERGIAHIIEHLGFSATKAYENHAIVKFLESIGAPFGACQNAYTSFDRTVYTLHVPTDKEGIVKESLTVLREFAYYTRISEEDLEKERKVVLEEWRESKNAQGRLFEQYINALCKDCKWCERLPIGKEDVIRGVSAETLRNFYKKWYHPGKMAVVAVGDFDGAEVTEMVKVLFDIAPEAIEPLARVSLAPERPLHVVPDSDGVVVASSSDPELSFAQGIIDCKRPKNMAKSLADFRRSLSEDLFHKAFGSRLLRLMLEPRGTRNFFMVGTDTGQPVPVLSPLSITIAPLPGRMRQTLAEIAREIERVKRLGFHASEVSRAKRALLADFEEGYIERNQRPSASIAEEYVSLFLDETPAPGAVKVSQIAATVLPSISHSEVSRVADQFNFDKNVVVKLATPPLSVLNPLYTCWNVISSFRSFRFPRPGVDLPESSEVAAILQSVRQETLEPWPLDEDDPNKRLEIAFQAATTDAGTSAPPPASGPASPHQMLRAVASAGVPRPESSDVKVNVHETPTDGTPLEVGQEVILRNGLRIFVKATDLFDDEICMRGRRWGGLSEHQGAGLMSGGAGIVSTEAQVCSMAAMMLGICGLSVESLQESLDGRRVDPNPPNMEAYTTGLDASTSPVDLETLLTLLHLLFVRPVETGKTSRGRLSLVKLGLLAWRLGEDRDPGAKFQKRVASCITGNHPYTRHPSLWSIFRLDFAKASRIFNERSSQPRDWTFVFVGKLPNSEILMPLLDKYLGSIPNVDQGIARAPGAVLRLPELQARQAVTALDVAFPATNVREEVHLEMIDPKGSNVLCFPLSLGAVASPEGGLATAEAELRELFRLRMLVRLLETRFIEVLRFKRGQVYGVSVREDFSFCSPHMGKVRAGTLSISFECNPAEADELLEATRAELARLRRGEAAFTDEHVDAAREQDRREFEELFRKNDWWANNLLDLYFSRCNSITEDISATLALWWRVRRDCVRTMDKDDALAAFNSFLPEHSTSVLVAMRPKKRRWWSSASGEKSSSSAAVAVDDDPTRQR